MFLQIGRTFVKVCLEKSHKIVPNVKATKPVIMQFESSKQLNKGHLDFCAIDKNLDNLKLEFGSNGNLSKPKVLFKVEKVENKNYKNLNEGDK